MTMLRFSRTLLLTGLWTAAIAAQAASYPSKPITLIVPYPPGGPNDVIARAVSNELGKQLKTSIVIENKPGAAGNIGTTLAARAQPDGYTLALPGSALSINTVIFDNVKYKISDFRAVGLVAKGPVVAVAHPSTHIKTVADIVAQAKAHPNALSFPSGGKGTSPHLTGALLNKHALIQMTHVPYKGTGEFIPDLLAGRVQVAFVSPLIAKQHIESGALVPLATTGSQRLRGWESLPTIAESGWPNVVLEPWYALVAPAATPQDVIQTLNTALQKALQSPELKAQLFNLGLDAVPGTAQAADQLIVAEVEKWKGVQLGD